ncbi:tryptophan synthase beta subunit-like PLP-dependent enzyme [Abortiporus biennis]|nr:tryptophan synthase beta subunit-like PLP-dependent enzyme [Abortiporus biennis]
MSMQDWQNLWLETPLIHSRHISASLGCDVYLKLENLQPSQSFKYRGISHFIQLARKTHGENVELVVASGGNAGLAAATVANVLGMKCTVFLPEGATQPVLNFFKQEGAIVKTIGSCYAQALKAAKEEVATRSNAVLVPAYEHPDIWEGHGSMINEISKQLDGVKPDAIFCNAGGGGLFGGVIVGCKAVGWEDVPLVVLETTGSNCFYESIALNPEGHFKPSTVPLSDNIEIIEDEKFNIKLAHLKKLNSRASSLGASSPSSGVVKLALDRGRVTYACAPDEFAMQVSALFAEDQKVLIELACATTLVPAYSPELFNKLVPQRADGTTRTIVFIVCGGFKVTLDELEEFKEIVKAELQSQERNWEVKCNGEQWSIPKH